jgi:isovaleryl-CoA dehydrogenase
MDSHIDLEDHREAVDDFVEAVRGLCQRRCGTREQREALKSAFDDDHDHELFAEMAELGWVLAGLPEAHGGGGLGLVAQSHFLEETSRAMAPIHGVGVTLVVAGVYSRLGTDEQRQRVLGRIGEGAVQAIAMSEPGAGSDVGSLVCRAERDGDEFVINGQKTWISYAHRADEILLIARSDRQASKHDGLTMLSVPTNAPGLEIRQQTTLGGRETCDLYFTDCRIPDANVVGAEGGAWKALMSGLNEERLIGSAMHLGLAQRAFEDTLAYVTERRQFGQPIGSFQALSQRLADMATEIECARLLVYSVAAKVDRDPTRLLPREASMVKLKTTEVCKHVALEGLQMMGGYGYSTEYDMERHVRVSLVGTIYGGTSEIQRNIIAKTFGL